jgi:succinate dehydrogenase / fumarate reductase flavoprotein subunit
MYTKDYMNASIKKVEASRLRNMSAEPRRLTAEEKDAVLAAYHPDYKAEEFAQLQVGPNRGEKAPKELVALLQGNSRILGREPNLDDIFYDVDVLIIGGGGAGCSAAIEAHNGGADVLIVTKLRMGDANTMMAQGGIRPPTSPTTPPPSISWTSTGATFARRRSLSISW